MEALYLMDGSIPPAILSTQILGLRPTSATATMLIQLMGRIGKSSPMSIFRDMFLRQDSVALLESIRFVTSILTYMGHAVSANQQVGFEFEFDPSTTSRDQAHILMARAFEDMGHGVEIKTGARNFEFGKQPKVAPIILGEGHAQGLPVHTEIFQSNGTILVSVVRDTDSARTHVIAANQTSSLADADALLHTILDAPPKEHYLIIAKDSTGDTLKMAVEITGKTTARLTGINGKFNGLGGRIHDYIDIDFTSHLHIGSGTNRSQLAAIIDCVKRALSRGLAIQKANRITHLQVHGIGSGLFQIVDEVPPYLEAISAKMNVGEVGATKPMIVAFQNSGFDGTRSSKMVGMHVHAEVQHQVDGKTTIGPALNLLRAFATHHHMIYNLFPSHTNRSGFIQRMPESYRKLLETPNYVTDPTDPVQIARVIADYNAHMPVKYSDLNMDNLFAIIVKNRGLDPALARTSPGKPTAELRLFDSIMDPDSVTFIAQFWGVFVYKHANSIP